MQVRITGTRITVCECRTDQAPRLDLAGTVFALAGEQHLALDQRQRIGNGGIVGGLDHRRHIARSDGPQCADGLHRAERQIEPGHGGLPRPRVPRHRRRQFPDILRLAATLAGEEFSRQLAADVCAVPVR